MTNTMKMFVYLIIIIVFGLCIYCVYGGSSGLFDLTGTVELGGVCTLPTDCVGWDTVYSAATESDAGKSPTTCCKGICTTTQKDWAGIGLCPDVCMDAPDPLGKPGSCEDGYSCPRKEGEPCDTVFSCEGGVADKVGTLTCCNNKCTKQLKNWEGIGYCPDVCMDAPDPLGKPGSCEDGYSWPRKEGEPCDTVFSCEEGVAGKVGTLACCNNKCTKQLKDWFGMGYCPADCRDAPAPLGKLGSCEDGYSWPRKEGEPCDTVFSCEGGVADKVGTLTCCNKKCTKQLKNWEGKGRCPDDCRDAPSPLGAKKSCESGYSWPRKEGEPCDTVVSCEGGVSGRVGSLTCCDKKCTKQLKNWDGKGLCPKDCIKNLGGKRGSC